MKVCTFKTHLNMSEEEEILKNRLIEIDIKYEQFVNRIEKWRTTQIIAINDNVQEIRKKLENHHKKLRDHINQQLFKVRLSSKEIKSFKQDSSQNRNLKRKRKKVSEIEEDDSDCIIIEQISSKKRHKSNESQKLNPYYSNKRNSANKAYWIYIMIYYSTKIIYYVVLTSLCIFYKPHWILLIPVLFMEVVLILQLFLLGDEAYSVWCWTGSILSIWALLYIYIAKWLMIRFAEDKISEHVRCIAWCLEGTHSHYNEYETKQMVPYQQVNGISSANDTEDEQQLSSNEI